MFVVDLQSMECLFIWIFKAYKAQTTKLQTLYRGDGKESSASGGIRIHILSVFRLVGRRLNRYAAATALGSKGL